MEEETKKSAEIVYEVWESRTVKLLRELEHSIDGHVSGSIPNPDNLEIYFTPFVNSKHPSRYSDSYGVKESIEAVMQLYLEGSSPIWDSWEEYEEYYEKNRKWGNFKGRKIHTHFIPDTMLVEMLNRLQAETKYSRGKFGDFADLYSLYKNYSVDKEETDLNKVFNEVVIHEISHYVLNIFCDKYGHSYPSPIGEAIGWFLDHKIYDNTYHSYRERNVGDLDIGIFSSYNFSEEETRYVVWLLRSMNFSYEVDLKNDKAKHPYPWSVEFIAGITDNEEINKKDIFFKLLPRETRDNLETLEEIIETEYRQEYEALLNTVKNAEDKIKEIEKQARDEEKEKEKLYQKKKFYQEMKYLKHDIRSDIGLEKPEEFEEFIENEIQESANQQHSLKEAMENMEQVIISHTEEQIEKLEAAIKLCVDKEKEMNRNNIGEINGEKIQERKDFLDTIKELNRIMEKLENHIGRVEHRFYLYQKLN